MAKDDQTKGTAPHSAARSAGAEKLGEFARTISQLLADRLAAQATKGDGKLASRDINAVLNSYTYDNDSILRGLCDSTWIGLQHHFEDAFYAQLRKFPLERLIVARFVHLLPDRGEPPVPGRTLSRRMIPAFIQALHQMVGPELFEEYEERARTMVETLRAQEGQSLDWDSLHERPMAKILVNDILIYITRYFMDISKRRTWMVSYFDRIMPPGKSNEERAWSFGDLEFHKLMAALYRELAETLFDKKGRQHLEERYDPASLSQLEQVLAGLAQDQKRVLQAH
jgi:hypothetical protein